MRLVFHVYYLFLWRYLGRDIYSHVQLAKKCQGKLYSVIKDSYFIFQKKSLLFLDCASSRIAVFKDTIISTIQVKVEIFSKINRYLIKVNVNA